MFKKVFIIFLVILLLLAALLAGYVGSQKYKKSSCESNGKNWLPAGLGKDYGCYTKATDTGKLCTDGGQCEGDCEIPALSKESKGYCSKYKDYPYGCRKLLTNGKVSSNFCLD